jgi:hypothetical protein
MADRTQPPHEQPITERRTPVNNDLDPDGMDPEGEADELEAAGSDADVDTEEADGTRDRNREPGAH